MFINPTASARSLVTRVSLAIALVTPAVAAISNNMLAWYRFDETNGTAVVDTVGQVPAGSLTATGVFARGTNRNAVALTGSSGLLAIPHDSRLNFAGPVAFSFWMKGSSNNQGGSTPTLLGKFNSSFANTGFDLITSTNAGQCGTLRFAARGTTGIDTSWVSANVLDDQWHHVVVVASNNGIALWVDGARKTWFTGTWSPGYNPVALMLGKRGSNDTAFLGSFDDFRIYTNMPAGAGDIAEMASLPSSLPTVALTPAPASTNMPFAMSVGWTGDGTYSNGDAFYYSVDGGTHYTRMAGGLTANPYLSVRDAPWQVKAFAVAYDGTPFAVTNATVSATVQIITPSIPTLLGSPVSTNTNMTVNLQWIAGDFGGAALAGYTVTVLLNGAPWLSVPVGLASNYALDLATPLGALSTNTLTYAVTASAGGLDFTSMSNVMLAQLSQKIRVRGLVRDALGNPLSQVVVQTSMISSNYLLTDSTGAFDLGTQTVDQAQHLRLTPPGRYGVLALASNLTLPRSDLDLVLTLTNAQAEHAPVIQLSAAPVFVGGRGGLLRLTVPLSWNDSRRLIVSAIPLAGGRKVQIYDGYVSLTSSLVEVAGATIQSALKPGPHVLEYHLTRAGEDEHAAQTARQLFFYAQ